MFFTKKDILPKYFWNSCWQIAINSILWYYIIGIISLGFLLRGMDGIPFGRVVKRLNITDIRVKKIPSEGKMRAVVSVTFDEAFVVHDIKIIEGQEKLFTAMPSRRTPENEFKDIAHPINSEMRETLEKAIIAKYEEVIAAEEE